MLTVDLLKSQAQLKDLNDEVLKVIADLSKNDEERVIDKTVKDIHDQYDADVLAVTGNGKPGGVKSYDHIKNELTRLKGLADGAGKAEELKKQVDALTTEKTELEKKLAENAGNEHLKGEFEKLQRRFNDRGSEIDKLKTAHTTEKTRLETELATERTRGLNLELTTQFDSHISNNNIKFKPGLEGNVLQEILKNRKSSLLAELKPEKINNNGKEVTVFRDANGDIMRDKVTIAPLTAGQIYLERIKDLVLNNGNNGGTGSGGGGNGGGGTFVMNLGSAKTQVEAVDMITNHLIQNEGLTKTNPEFDVRQREIAKENNVSNLPLR